MFSIFHILAGYCQVALKGPSQERFLNLCASKKLLLWNMKRKDNHYIFCISKRASFELEEISKKTGCGFLILQKTGLPFFFGRYRKRKILALSFFITILTLYLLSLRMWRIEISGASSYSDRELLRYLTEKGIESGVVFKKVNCEELEEEIREDFEKVAWVSCQKEGTVLKVALKETLDTCDEKEEGSNHKPCDLVANKSGIIDSIMVRGGSGMVKKGDAVKKGDVLISGIIEFHDDGGNVTETAKVMAEGDIYAKTKLPYENTFSLVSYKKEKTGVKDHGVEVKILNKRIQVKKISFSYPCYEDEIKEKNLHIGSQFYLPFSIDIVTRYECTPQKQIYTKTQAKNIAMHRLDTFLKDYELKGVEILKNNVKIDCDENECTAKGVIEVKERIGKKSKIKAVTKEGAIK